MERIANLYDRGVCVKPRTKGKYFNQSPKFTAYEGQQNFYSVYVSAMTAHVATTSFKSAGPAKCWTISGSLQWTKLHYNSAVSPGITQASAMSREQRKRHIKGN